MRHSKTLLFSAVGCMAASLALGMGGGPAWAAGHGGGKSGGADSPPGNNGTVKIDQYSMDPGQDNDPHLSCDFSVNFYGYDGGPQTATVYVTPVAPTAGSHTYTASTSWDVGTRTSGAQFDRTVPVSSADLASTLSGVTPQPQQGYHLRLEVEVSGSKGSNDKYKVFWLEPCSGSGSTSPGGGGQVPGSGGTGGSSVPPNGGTTSNIGGSTPPGGGSTPPGAGTSVNTPKPATLSAGTSGATGSSGTLASAGVAARSSATPASASVLTASTARSGASPAAFSPTSRSGAAPVAGQVGSGSLAFTGIDVAGMVTAGLGLIAAGLLLTSRSRRAHT